MPTYEFKCNKCQMTLEQVFSVYTNATMWCETCKLPMEKQFASVNVIFKGDGWGGSKK